MEAIYYDVGQPGSLSGVRTLSRYSKQNVEKVKQFLSSQPAYTMHRPIRRKFVRRKTISKGINDLFQLDIADMSNVSRDNDGYRYLLTCIDVLSKYGFVVPLKTKGAKEVTDAFENKILTERRCRMLQTDKGSEFRNTTFQNMLKKYGIHWYTSENDDIKASVVERFNRTIKERIYRYFTYKNTHRYVHVLGDLVTSYNNSLHRSIGMTPSEVTTQNEQQVLAKLYPKKPKTFNWKLRIGDHVRLSMTRAVFRKGYVGNWTGEIFTVVAQYPTVPVTYGIADANSEVIKGKFYEEELQLVQKPSDEFYEVEKILRKRKRGNKTEYFVKWKHYPDSMNSWTDAVRKL
jgi:transposase InsO family protein